jgi:hypothetical protein
MEKKFLAISVVAFVVFFAFTARSAHADSIRLSDLRLDSAMVFSNSNALDAAVVPNLFDRDFSFQSLLSDGLPVFAGVLRGRGTGEDDLSLTPDRTFGWPMASHLARRFETGGLGSASDGSGSTAVPEPASALLAGVGILGLTLFAMGNRNKPPLLR